MPETTHLRVTLVSVTGYFLDPEICNKITLPILVTKTGCFKCALLFLFFEINSS